MHTVHHTATKDILAYYYIKCTCMVGSCCHSLIGQSPCQRLTPLTCSTVHDATAMVSGGRQRRSSFRSTRFWARTAPSFPNSWLCGLGGCSRSRSRIVGDGGGWYAKSFGSKIPQILKLITKLNLIVALFIEPRLIDSARSECEWLGTNYHS